MSGYMGFASKSAYNRYVGLSYVYFACTHGLALRYAVGKHHYPLNRVAFRAAIREAKARGWLLLKWSSAESWREPERFGRLTPLGVAEIGRLLNKGGL